MPRRPSPGRAALRLRWPCADHGPTRPARPPLRLTNRPPPPGTARNGRPSSQGFQLQSYTVREIHPRCLSGYTVTYTQICVRFAWEARIERLQRCFCGFSGFSTVRPHPNCRCYRQTPTVPSPAPKQPGRAWTGGTNPRPGGSLYMGLLDMRHGGGLRPPPNPKGWDEPCPPGSSGRAHD